MPSSPTRLLLLGLIVSLAAVCLYSWYTLQQVEGLRQLQTQTLDRSRKDTLQLLRIQNNCATLAGAMRDLLSGADPYPMAGYEAQFCRIRGDLEDALRIENQLAPTTRAEGQQQMLRTAVERYWAGIDRLFHLARAGNEPEARRLVRDSLQPELSALTALVARLLVQNNEAEERAIAEVQVIYNRVEGNLYGFLAGMLIAMAVFSLAVIHYNRRVFDRMAQLSNEKSTLARKLIEVQEQVLRSVSRELHDEFGQILTAMGVMLSRVEKKGGLPADSPLQRDLREVREIAAETLEKIRGLSQMLHPAVLDDHGLDKALDWYLPLFERQTGIHVRYQKTGEPAPLDAEAAVHVYRILQEALNNAAKHAGVDEVKVRMAYTAERLRLEVEDAGPGLHPAVGPGRGLGLVAMRERAELLGGKLSFQKPPSGGTLVSLEVRTAAVTAVRGSS